MALFPGKGYQNQRIKSRNFIKYDHQLDHETINIESNGHANHVHQIQDGLNIFNHLVGLSSDHQDSDDEDDLEQGFIGFTQEFVFQRRSEELKEISSDPETDESQSDEDHNEEPVKRKETIKTRKKKKITKKNEENPIPEKKIVKNDQKNGLEIKKSPKLSSINQNQKLSNVNHDSNEPSPTTLDVSKSDKLKARSRRRSQCSVETLSSSEAPSPVLVIDVDKKKKKKLVKKKSKRARSSNSDSTDNDSESLRKKAIKRDMVSRYTELISKSGQVSSKQALSSPSSPPKDKYAAKIEKLLKSQWEERLKKQQDQQESPSERVDVTLSISKQEPIKPTQKSILRQPRLQLSMETLLQLREPSSLQDLIFDNSPQSGSNLSPRATNVSVSSKSNTQKKQRTINKTVESDLQINKPKKGSGGRPGFITCAICNITKYYSHVQRRHGQFSCEPCSKFFGRFLRNPKQYFCPKNGDCTIEVDKNSTDVSPTFRASATRCRACWLKTCLQKFIVAPETRSFISSNFAPKLQSSPNVSLIAVDTRPDSSPNVQLPSSSCESQPLLMVATERASPSLSIPSSSRVTKNKVRTSNSKGSGKRQGPRVKHVCRSAGNAKSLPRATFSRNSSSKVSDNDSDELPLDVYISRAYEKEQRKSVDPEIVPPLQINLKTSDETKRKKVKKKVPKLMTVSSDAGPSKQLNKTTGKIDTMNHNSFDGKMDECNKDPRQDDNDKYMSETKSKTDDKKQLKPKKIRCKECVGCRAEDCGVCVYCLDKKKFGGSNVIKQACKYRKCIKFLTSLQVNAFLSERSEMVEKLGTLPKQLESDKMLSQGLPVINNKEITKPKTNGAFDNINSSKSQQSYSIRSLHSSSSSSTSSESSNENIDVTFLLSAGNAGHGKPSLLGNKEQFIAGNGKTARDIPESDIVPFISDGNSSLNLLTPVTGDCDNNKVDKINNHKDGSKFNFGGEKVKSCDFIRSRKPCNSIVELNVRSSHQIQMDVDIHEQIKV